MVHERETAREKLGRFIVAIFYSPLAQHKEIEVVEEDPTAVRCLLLARSPPPKGALMAIPMAAPSPIPAAAAAAAAVHKLAIIVH